MNTDNILRSGFLKELHFKGIVEIIPNLYSMVNPKSNWEGKKNLPIGRFFLLTYPKYPCNYFTATNRGTTPNCPCIILAFATAIDLLFLAPRSKNKTDSEILVLGNFLSDIHDIPDNFSVIINFTINVSDSFPAHFIKIGDNLKK